MIYSLWEESQKKQRDRKLSPVRKSEEGGKAIKIKKRKLKKT